MAAFRGEDQRVYDVRVHDALLDRLAPRPNLRPVRAPRVDGAVKRVLTPFHKNAAKNQRCTPTADLGSRMGCRMSAMSRCKILFTGTLRLVDRQSEGQKIALKSRRKSAMECKIVQADLCCFNACIAYLPRAGQTCVRAMSACRNGLACANRPVSRPGSCYSGLSASEFGLDKLSFASQS
jgi:hypothetical protein